MKHLVKTFFFSAAMGMLWTGFGSINSYGTEGEQVQTEVSTGQAVEEEKVQTKVETSKPKPKKITLSHKKLVLRSKRRGVLRVKNNGSRVVWRSSNNAVVYVNSLGKIVAREAGTAVIYAKADKQTVTCQIRVLYQSGQRVANYNDRAYKNRTLNNLEKGQCVWYAFGRTYEKLGIRIQFSQPWNRNAIRWLRIVETGRINRSKYRPKANSIAVSNGSSYGHVIFVEDVYNGLVYYSEGNTNGGGRISRTKDGVIKVLSVKAFASRKHIQGYIQLPM